MDKTTKPSFNWEIKIGILNNISVVTEVLKVFCIGAAVPFLLVFILWAVDGFPEIIDLGDGKYFLILIAITLGITVLILLLSGNRYPIRYELNKNGVTFITLPKQRRKNKVIAMLLIFLGAVKGSPGSMGVGMMASSRQNMHTEWKKVRKIICYRKRNSIALKCSDMTKNILFCHKENIDEVFHTVCFYCPKAKIEIR